MDKVRGALAELVRLNDIESQWEHEQPPLEGWRSAWAAAREALSVQPAPELVPLHHIINMRWAYEQACDLADWANASGSGLGDDEKLYQAAVKLRDTLGKATHAQPAPSVPAVPEFCCEHAWSAAKQLAWKERDLSCDCDHNEYCQKCFPLEFRAGGKWNKYAAAPHPAAKGGAE